MTPHPPMRVHLMGGLGNQLFIYAAALALARRRGLALALDAHTAFAADHVYRREYLLDQFAITAPLLPRSECFVGLWRWWLWRAMIERERRGFAGRAWAVIEERTAPERYAARKLHLFGQWASEDYFTDSADAVRREFQATVPLSATTQAELAAIHAQPQPVTVGIRRFNERPDPRLGYTTPVEFYDAALAEVARRVPGAHVFFVSEEPEWVRQNVRCPLPHTLITHKEGNRRAYENLTLMRACRHFIFGNSTYHWWGAWLGEKPGSQVIVDGRFAGNGPRFFPDRWHRLRFDA